MSETVNPMAMPRIVKVVVNIGVGEGGDRLTNAEKVLKMVTGVSPIRTCLLYTSPSPRDGLLSRMPSSA